MLGKIICWDETREECASKLYRALARVNVEGVATTSDFLQALIGHSDFRHDRINTRWLEEKFMAEWLRNDNTAV